MLRSKGEAGTGDVSAVRELWAVVRKQVRQAEWSSQPVHKGAISTRLLTRNQSRYSTEQNSMKDDHNFRMN
jgi:pyridoxal biosynthesis lyase PdxS